MGGKTYENSMGNVQEFIRCLCEAMAKTDFIYVHIYMDEDFKSAEHFTVSSLADVRKYLYNFVRFFKRHLETFTSVTRIYVY